MNDIFPNPKGFLHGGDYNPDQWLDMPEILEKDIELMKKAHINVVSLGIFSWSKLEPREGEYDFDWLEKIIDHLYENGIYTILATPSGSKPFWMSEKYEEIRRCDNRGVRDYSGARHNHCLTSPVYREFVRKIDTKLAERFGNNPAVIMWHIGNEFGGECYCPLCREAFRGWLKNKYHTIDEVNHYWCTAFWSHHFDDFSQIYPPMANGEHSIHGLNADWFRFISEQTADFINEEIKAVKSVNPNIPATTNLMGFCGYNYFKLKDIIDVVSWDSYPQWHMSSDISTAMNTACQADVMRMVGGGKPFMLMESTPSTTNWFGVSKLKRPNMHMASSLQMIAHGSDTVQYFQIRKARGNSEKFHGAVIDHYGEENRVFNDVKQVGERLEQLSKIKGSLFKSEVAILFDYENRHALFDSCGPRNSDIGYEAEVCRHYNAFWRMGINTDVVDMSCDLSKYKLVVAPMLYMLREGIENKLRDFVKGGGTLVGTYHSAIVDEHDLCYLGGVPGGGLREVFGIWNEEIDALTDWDKNSIIMNDGREYEAHRLCAIIHSEGAEVLGRYGSDFYKDTPAFTVNKFGEGKAYYIAAATNDDFVDDLHKKLVGELNIAPSVQADLPQGVTAHNRIADDGQKFIFIENYSGKPCKIALKKSYCDMNGNSVDFISLKDYDVAVVTE